MAFNSVLHSQHWPAFAAFAKLSVLVNREVLSHVGFGWDAWKGLVEAEVSLWARYHCDWYCLAACDTVGLLSSDVRLYVRMFARVCVFDIFAGVALLWCVLYFGWWHRLAMSSNIRVFVYILQCVTVCYSVLQCVAVCCSASCSAVQLVTLLGYCRLISICVL